MKIEQFGGDRSYYAERQTALRALIEHATRRDGRPCPGCEIECPKCGSRSCLCSCAPGCAQAPLELSSDPEKFPIEDGAVPLVYALNDLAIGLPCWSCEGHAETENTAGKTPQVWFYVRHLVFPDLLAHYLWRLHYRKQIANRWKIAVVSTNNNIDTTFAISPDSAQEGASPSLDSLRADIRVIGKRMNAEIAELARDNLDAIDDHFAAAAES